MPQVQHEAPLLSDHPIFDHCNASSCSLAASVDVLSVPLPKGIHDA